MGQAERSAGKRSEQAARRREELLDAAIATIRRVGPSTSMDDIAHEARITRPILYRHFGDRGGLVRAVSERFAAGMLGEIESVLNDDNPAAGDPAVLVEELIGAFFASVESDPMLYRFIVHRALYEDADARGSLEGFVELIRQRLAVIIGELLHRAGRDTGPAEPWATATIGMVIFTAEWWLARGVLTRERITSYLSSLVVDGFATALSPAGTPATGFTGPLVHAARSAAVDVVDAAASAVASTIRRVPKGSTP